MRHLGQIELIDGPDMVAVGTAVVIHARAFTGFVQVVWRRFSARGTRTNGHRGTDRTVELEPGNARLHEIVRLLHEIVRLLMDRRVGVAANASRGTGAAETAAGQCLVGRLTREDRPENRHAESQELRLRLPFGSGVMCRTLDGSILLTAQICPHLGLAQR